MADNITLNAGSGGQVIRALDDGTAIFPVGITAFATSVADPDVCSIVTPATGLPVRLADGSGYIATLPVSLASVPSHAVTGPLTDAELRASAVPVSLASVPSHAVTNAGTFAVQAAQSGAWTVELGATDNAVLDAIAASLAGTLTVGSHAVTNAGTFAVQAAQSGTWNITNVSGTISLPTGAATAANQATANASLATIAGAVSGTEVQVDVLTMPTVTVSDGGGAITVDGTVTANAGTGTFAVSAASLPLPTGAATLAEQQTQTTALQLLDDSVATTGAAITAKGIAAVGTDGTNARILKTDASGELQVDVLSMPTTTVTGTVAATQSGTWTVTGAGGSFPVTDSGGSLTVDAPVGTPVFVRLSDGASAITTLPVSLASVPSHAVTNAGTFAVQVDGDALTSLQLLDDAVAATGAAITAKGIAAVGTDGTNARILKTDASGELQVDVLSMPTTTVTGAVAATQSGTWTVQPGNTANTTAWLVTGTGGTFPVTDSGGSLTVDNNGTFVVQENGAALTALQLIDDAVATTGAAITAKGIAAVGTDGTNARILKTDASGELQVDVLTMPTITANLGTIADVATQTTLAALNAKVTAVDTGAVVVTTLPSLPAGTSNIGDVDVLSLPSLAVGDNAIGRVKLTDGTDVADVLDLANANPLTVAIVDGSGDQITAFGGGTQYTEGDTDASITGTAFLWEDTGDTLRAVSAAKPLPIGDAGGSLTVDNGGTFAVQAAQSGTWNITNVSGTVSLPTGASTLAEQQTQTTALQLIDDAVATTASAIPAKGFAVSGTDGTNARILKTDASGELQVDVLSMPTTTVTGAVAATQSGTWTVTGTGGTFPMTDSGGSLTVDAPVGTPVFVRLSDGSSAISTLPVSLASVPSHAVTNAGTFAVQAAQSGTWNVGTVTTVSTLTGGGIAHDSADSGNPHKVGAKAKSTLGGITLVSADDRTDLYADVDGVLLVREHAPLADNVSGVASITGGSSTSVIAAQGSGVKTYITDVTIANTSATAVTVDIRDGAAGSVKWTFPVPANTAGVVYSFKRPLAFSANTAVCADPSAAASTITVSLNGFKSKV